MTISANHDYCGQPIPHDVAQEGFSKGTKHNSPNPEFTNDPFADPQDDSQLPQPGSALSGNVVYIPPGASIPLVLDRTISSGNSKVGDVAYAYVDGYSLGLPQGTIAELVVIMVEPASRGFAKAGRIQIASNRLILPDKQSVWIRGLVVDRLGDSELGGEKRGRRALNSFGKIALGAGAGAVSGLTIGAVADARLGAATLVGTAIGAVAGGIWAAATKGKEVTLQQGMPVRLQVTEGAQAML
ncbi:MAG: hypothetical protein QNJ31_03385 [Candidatus Caenarcaniphilales bacterium]|nr:hypothetical protein [Candidatus Caenarcaniphilales bacterium]